MRKLFALPLGAVLLAACAPRMAAQTAAPTLSPTLSNVHNQRGYCVSRNTYVNFGLDYTGDIGRVEVYAVSAGSGPPGGRNPGRFVDGGGDVFLFQAGHVMGSVVFQPGAGSVRVVPAGGQAQLPSITVDPAASYDLYFRAFSVSGPPSAFVAGQTVAPDAGVNCDPDLHY